MVSDAQKVFLKRLFDYPQGRYVPSRSARVLEKKGLIQRRDSSLYPICVLTDAGRALVEAGFPAGRPGRPGLYASSAEKQKEYRRRQDEEQQEKLRVTQNALRDLRTECVMLRTWVVAASEYVPDLKTLVNDDPQQTLSSVTDYFAKMVKLKNLKIKEL